MFFRRKKSVANPIPAGASDDWAETRSSRGQQLDALKRIFNSVKIGSRIRYHQEYEQDSILETLVIGYCINDIAVYRQADIEIQGDEGGIPRVVVHSASGVDRALRVDSIQLMVPGAIGEERKLDYDSRATLGRRGPFAPGSRLVVMSTSYNSEHLKLEVQVQRNKKLTEGIHAGMQVALLDVQADSLTSHEPRQYSRVLTDLPVTLSKNGTEQVMPVRLKDFSEKTLCLALDRDGDIWPEFTKKDFALLGVKSSIDKPMVKLRCVCVENRGDLRIFEMTHIGRQGALAPIEMIDVLEIKIDLINHSG